MAIKKLCPSCGRITTNRCYCDACEKARTDRRWSAYQEKRKALNNGVDFYNTKEWKTLRLTVLERDHYLCQSCLKKGLYVDGNQVDHIIPRSQGGADTLNNLQTLCKSCHREKTAQEGGGFRMVKK